MTNNRHVHAAVAVFDAILRCYPDEFRDRFSGEMRAVFAELCRDAEMTGGARSVVRTCMASAIDVLRNAPGERWRAHSRQVRAASKSGEVVTAAAKALVLACVPAIVVARVLLGALRDEAMAAPLLCVLVIHCAIMHVAVSSRARPPARAQGLTKWSLRLAASSCVVLALSAPGTFVQQLQHHGAQSLVWVASITVPACLVLACAEHVRPRLARRA